MCILLAQSLEFRIAVWIWHGKGMLQIPNKQHRVPGDMPKMMGMMLTRGCTSEHSTRAFDTFEDDYKVC